MLVLMALFACGDDTPEPTTPDEPEDTGEAPDTDVPEDTAPPEDTGTKDTGTKDTGTKDTGTKDTGGEDTGGEEPGIIVDCAMLPSSPGYNVLNGPRGYHGLLFDEDGYVMGSDTNSIIKADYKGSTSVLTPSQGIIEQLAWLADGDVVFGSLYGNKLVRLDPKTGGTSTLASSTYGYGVIVGSDEMIYIADNQRVSRVDPKTGDKEVLISTLPGSSGPRVIVFNEDETILYIGTLSNNGQVFAQELDKDHEPVGQPALYANGVGSGYHDGIALDVCGNLYVTDYTTRGIYKVATDGTVTTLLSGLGSNHGHGMAWGSGIGGWREMSLYLPLPYNSSKVMELGLGVPGVGWEGTVINK